MTRHGQVKKKNIGLEFPSKLDSLGTISRFPDHTKAFLRIEKTPQSIAENRVIVRDQKQDFLRATVHRLHAAEGFPTGLRDPEMTQSPDLHQGSAPVLSARSDLGEHPPVQALTCDPRRQNRSHHPQ